MHLHVRHVMPYRLTFFFFNDPATTEIYPLSLHDALPISCAAALRPLAAPVRASPPPETPPAARHFSDRAAAAPDDAGRSEEHTSELQSRLHLVCRLLLAKKNHQRSGE